MNGRHRGSILALYLWQRHFPHSTDNNRYSCVRSQSTCLCFLVRRSRFIRENWPEWWEQELRFKQLGRHLSNGRNSPKSTQKASGFSLRSVMWRRNEARRFLHLCAHKSTHLDEDLRMNWSLVSQLNMCRNPVCGLVDGSKYHRYEPQQDSWFAVGSSCCLALHASVIIRCVFSRVCYK